MKTVRFTGGAAAAVFAASLLLGGHASAGVIEIANGGFEMDDFGDGGWDLVATAWSRTSGTGTWNPTSDFYPGEAPEGENVGFARPGEALWQVLSGVTLTENTMYTLEVEVGRRITTPYPGYSIQLLAGDTVLAEDLNSLDLTAGEFSTSTITFEAGAIEALVGETLSIRLAALEGTPVGQVNFDNVQLTAISTIPAPATLAVFGLAGLSRRRRRSA